MKLWKTIEYNTNYQRVLKGLKTNKLVDGYNQSYVVPLDK